MISFCYNPLFGRALMESRRKKMQRFLNLEELSPHPAGKIEKMLF